MKTMPPEFFAASWNAHIKPCGNFLSVGEQIIDGNAVINKLHYEKLGVAVRITISSGIVIGLLLQYFKEKNL